MRDDRPWPLYPLEPGQTYVNVGFWSTVPADEAAGPGATNRCIEEQVSALGGHKSLYSEAFYDQETFGGSTGAPPTRPVKQRYDPDHRLPDLYAKAVQGA